MEQKDKTDRKEVSNKGICRVKVGSFVALRSSLSVETWLKKRIPWSRDAELSRTVVLNGIDDAW